MKLVKIAALLLTLAGMTTLPRTAFACPACADAIAASDTASEDANDFPAAMNQSIYLMVSAPYLSLGFVTFLIYRGYKKNEEYFRQQDTY